ncbi:MULTISPECIES: uracil-DNA glycosylase family protein [unclassified Thioalkalivibrio]|uniref:uracil-DNA glycosylase n=1 Tax=unclassified Thioalkalivibrio TaxID=2621013 RepID=UPI00038299FF|nr:MULTISPECIES: uracil-DNA glycosylase [unclassified Thioalkalivibrio]
MSLSVRQRRILADMGIPVWRSRVAAAPAIEAPPGEPLAPAAEVPSGAADAGGGGQDAAVATLDLEALQTRVRDCQACAELARERTQTVFGVGDPRARWLFIGEAPGAEEDRRGEPFVGRAGQLLDNMLRALGLERGHDVFIANVLKCRPPGNRDPKPEESAACRAYLDRQIALIQPQVIVALGRIAAQSLLASEEPLGRLRGAQHRYQGVPLVVTYHPAYLLRKPGDKGKAWQDLQRARAFLE